MLTQQIFNGLALGMGYALIAVGYSLVFGILRLVNFSHGSIYAFGAEMSMVFIGLNFGIVPGIIASMIVTGILGVTIDKIALEPLRKKKVNADCFFDHYYRCIEYCNEPVDYLSGIRKEKFSTAIQFWYCKNWFHHDLIHTDYDVHRIPCSDGSTGLYCI